MEISAELELGFGFYCWVRVSFSFLLILELEPPLAPTPSFRASASGGLGACLVQAA